MPIHHLLYRCPLCNSETSVSEPDLTSCANCGTKFSKSTKSQILVQPQKKDPYLTSAFSLITRMEESLKLEIELMETRQNLLRSEAVLGHVSEYLPVHSGGKLLGYTEVITEQISGFLLLGNTLEFVDENGKDILHRWDFEQLNSLIISSKAIQIYVRKEGLYQFRLIKDSPKLWEDSLKKSVERFYLVQGLEVFTYQPVIKTRKLTA